VAPDTTGTITIDGPAVTVTTTTAGQDGRLTFSGTAGQRITALVTNASNPMAYVKLVRPDGTTQASVLLCPPGCGTSSFIDTQVLATTGTYTLWVQHYSTNVGSQTLQLNSVAADVAGSITINGPAVSVTVSTAGQNAALTFSATSGQQVTVHLTNNTLSTTTVKLLKPDGSQQTSYISGSSSFNLTTQTLPSTGTYTITVDPSGPSVGSITVTVTSP
jgi:hypothetical protein